MDFFFLRIFVQKIRQFFNFMRKLNSIRFDKIIMHSSNSQSNDRCDSLCEKNKIGKVLMKISIL